MLKYKHSAAAKSLQSCLTLCDPIDVSPWGSPVPGIIQARTLEWVAISFSNAGKWKVRVKSLSRVWLLATPWTAAHQAPSSMGFSRQEYTLVLTVHFDSIGPFERTRSPKLVDQSGQFSLRWSGPGKLTNCSTSLNWLCQKTVLFSHTSYLPVSPVSSCHIT